jgi:hypothetical protein
LTGGAVRVLDASNKRTLQENMLRGLRPLSAAAPVHVVVLNLKEEVVTG